MFVLEHLAKQLLTAAHVMVPRGDVAATPDEAERVAASLNGRVVVKAQIPAGKRGKGGAIQFAEGATAVRKAAQEILTSRFAGYAIEQVLVEQCIPIARELYVAILHDTSRKCPLVLFASEGGMEVEEMYEAFPDKIAALPVDIRRGLDPPQAYELVQRTSIEGDAQELVADVLVRLYGLYRKLDAELLEINPLALTTTGSVVALDCKLVTDDSALRRHAELPPPYRQGTPLELRARDEGLLYLELDGDIAVLANGAGLTMATMDTITFYGGRPANFMEIGGQAYTKAAAALSIVLAKPGVRSLVVNLCGAFARTDVMAGGITQAWRELNPQVPVTFSIHGTGQDEAIRLVREQLGIEPYDLMDDAVKAAIRFARESHGGEA
jgi:succinyl-CoA synthetase beta subunit